MKILSQPLVLLISLVIFPVVAINATERTAVCDEGLSLGRESLVALDITDKRPLGTVCKVCLGVDADEVGKTIVEGVPEVTNTTTLDSGHAESMLEGCEVSTIIVSTKVSETSYGVTTYL
jgi:hypothetical protein